MSCERHGNSEGLIVQARARKGWAFYFFDRTLSECPHGQRRVLFSLIDHQQISNSMIHDKVFPHKSSLLVDDSFC
jgi:hypothetical protein